MNDEALQDRSPQPGKIRGKSQHTVSDYLGRSCRKLEMDGGPWRSRYSPCGGSSDIVPPNSPGFSFYPCVGMGVRTYLTVRGILSFFPLLLYHVESRVSGDAYEAALPFPAATSQSTTAAVQTIAFIYAHTDAPSLRVLRAGTIG